MASQSWSSPIFIVVAEADKGNVIFLLTTLD